MTVPDRAIDIHVHAGPSFFDRKYTAIGLAKEMLDAGFSGFVLKSHFGNTHEVAGLVRDVVSGIDVFPALTLNSFVGGMNPTAVEHALETDVRIVWLPTFSAANHSSDRDFPFSNQSLTVTTDAGELTDATWEVLETIADADRAVTVGNGHLSRDESFAVLEAMETLGIEDQYLITHADFSFMGLSMEDQIELAERGAIIEKCYFPVVRDDVTVEEIARSIRDIGPENCVISTDHGQLDNDSPAHAYAEFVEGLREAGLSSSDIERVTASSPRRVVGH